ncbi:MAG: hypothetical protein QOD66_3365, partial [Solirubrobacteraceae bacterium]|nr:hypothetical protein [Solirubrobacteraceae bacterium]
MSTRPVLMSRLRAPLTPTQRDVHLDQQLHPGLTIYSIGCSVCVGPELDRALWEEAVRAVFASEPIMRTRLEESEVEVFQYVDDQASMHLGFDDGVAADADALHAWIDQRLRESRGPQALFQHWLVRTTDGNFYAALGAPHPLSDGHSYRLFFERVSRCYEALLEQRPLPELISPSFYDYVREAAPVTDDAEALALWQTRLAGVGPLHFRTRREVPGDYGTERVRLSTAETEAVATFCRKHSCGLATFFLALHATVLQRYREPTGDWAVHVIRGARPPRFRETMGCFFDVLPYRMPEERLRRPARLADLFGYLRDYRRDLGPRHEISMLRLQDCLPNSGCRAVYNF